MSNTIVLKKGLDIPIAGAAEPVVSKTALTDIIAIQPSDFKGLTPRLLVKEGDRVLAGSPVLSDKLRPEILVTSPVSGTVQGIVRGEKRKLLAVCIANDHLQTCADSASAPSAGADAQQVKKALLAAGLWPWIVQRPYGVIADPGATPKAIFVSAFSTAPLAPDPVFCFDGSLKYIQAAISALAGLSAGGVHVGLPAGTDSPFARLTGCTLHRFAGKHPAGNVGVQISHICPIRKDETVWTVSLLGLEAIGRFLATGKVDLRRKVAVCGPMAIEPSYVETLPGMQMKEIAGHYGTSAAEIRFISGDALSGRSIGEDGCLGFFDNQITLLREGTEEELLGWIRPLRWKQYSHDHSYFSWLTPWRRYGMDTNLHGGPRAFLMNEGYYQKVLPMDIFPVFLAKACLAGDIEKMEKFGIYEVLPEDLAVCEFIDPSKNNIQDIIAQGIDLMRKEMA
ncbi:MAG: Na(+)-translocating NADH-quinone reductase subunit A [Bacteroidales bacterium]|nr:Na(+)-translocating NADH-quinone reductase subunit A [Bacteroidales bacterium]